VPAELRFLALCLRSVDPSLQLTRQLVESSITAVNTKSSTSSVTGVTSRIIVDTEFWLEALRH
jgi:hypothetical protein